MSLSKKIISEFLGTFFLLLAVIGSGIMAENLSGGNEGLALLANTMATVFVLYVLIETLAPLSGAHFNPVVTIVMYFQKKVTFKDGCFYITFQLLGALLGAAAANFIFGLELIHLSMKPRLGLHLFISELLATTGLLAVILVSNSQKTSSLVACYIGAAYWFSSSTSFANPAAVFGRMFSNSFAGIRPEDALYFVAAQLLAGLLVQLTCKILSKQ